MGIGHTLCLKLAIGIAVLSILLQIIHHGVADRIGKRSLFAVKDALRQIVSLEGMAEQVFAFAVLVQLHLRVNAHHILHKIQITERHSCFQGVDGDTAVSPKHIVHMQLPDALDGFLLELLRRRGKVGVLIAEQLVADLARQQNTNIGLFVDGLADQIHTHAGADGGDVVGAQQCDHGFKGRDHFFRGHINFRVFTADVVRHFLCVLQVDSVLAHADGKGADRFIGAFLRHSAYQRGVQTAAEKKTDLGIGNQPLFNTGDQLLANIFANGLQIIVTDTVYLCRIPITDELAILIIMSGREGHDFTADPHKVFCFAGKNDRTLFIVSVIEWPDADGVAGGNKRLFLRIVQDQRKFRIQHPEHGRAVLLVKGQQDFAIGLALE